MDETKEGPSNIPKKKKKLPPGMIEFDPSKCTYIAEYKKGEYANSGTIPFSQLLQTHHKQVIWGFKFGEEVRKQAQDNMRLARDKSVQEKRKIDEVSISPPRLENNPETSATYVEEPCCSKSLPEINHKTPHSQRRKKMKRRSRRLHETEYPKEMTRNVPLPLLSWADSREVWLYMIYKEEALLNLRNPRLFEDFTNLLPRMRAILLDWLMEVCDVYHLRRVTYYLSVDYFDRFLSIKPDVPKNQLQLVGITCLFLACKLEEVNPPRLTELSYVCDGACSPDDILNCELLILNCLSWDLNLMTPSDWLNLYMQIHFNVDWVTKQRLHRDVNRTFLFPQYSGYQFTRASHMIDLCSLDPGFMKFNYSTIAAAAMYFMYGKKVALSASGLTWDQLKECAEYMAVFYQVVRDSNDPKLQACTRAFHEFSFEDKERTEASLHTRVHKFMQSDNYNLQTHVINMDYFEKSMICRLQQLEAPKIKEFYQNTAEDKVDTDAGTECVNVEQVAVITVNECEEKFEETVSPGTTNEEPASSDGASDLEHKY